MVQLAKFKYKALILMQTREDKSRGLSVNEDFSQRLLDKRKKFEPAMKKAREAGKIAYLSYDRLVVKSDPTRPCCIVIFEVSLQILRN